MHRVILGKWHLQESVMQSFHAPISPEEHCYRPSLWVSLGLYDIVQTYLECIWPLWLHCSAREWKWKAVIFFLIKDYLLKDSDVNWVVYAWCLTSRWGWVAGRLSLPSGKRQHKMWSDTSFKPTLILSTVKIDSESVQHFEDRVLITTPTAISHENHSKYHVESHLFSKSELSLC